MLMGLGLAIAMIAVILVLPDSGTGRGLRRILVEAPARHLNRLRSGQVAFYAGLGLLGLVMVMAFEAEGLRVFGLILPETLVWFAMFDVAVFIDALLITGAVLATNGLRVVRDRVQTVLGRAPILIRRTAARARRVLRPASRPKGRTDDDGPAGLAQPAYRAFSMA